MSTTGSVEQRRERGPLAHIRGNAGFSLVELLVVILILAILAAIAVPFLLRQREKGYVAQIVSSLREGAGAAETAALADTYSALDDNTSLLYEEGYRSTNGVLIGISADDDSFCLAAVHQRLPDSNEWQVGTYDSATGTISPGTAGCPGAVDLASGTLPPIASGDTTTSGDTTVSGDTSGTTTAAGTTSSGSGNANAGGNGNGNGNAGGNAGGNGKGKGK